MPKWRMWRRNWSSMCTNTIRVASHIPHSTDTKQALTSLTQLAAAAIYTLMEIFPQHSERGDVSALPVCRSHTCNRLWSCARSWSKAPVAKSDGTTAQWEHRGYKQPDQWSVTELRHRPIKHDQRSHRPSIKRSFIQGQLIPPPRRFSVRHSKHQQNWSNFSLSMIQ